MRKGSLHLVLLVFSFTAMAQQQDFKEEQKHYWTNKLNVEIEMGRR
jgi:hypothetical protein